MWYNISTVKEKKTLTKPPTGTVWEKEENMVNMYITNELEKTTMDYQQFSKAVLSRKLKGIIFQDQEEKEKFIKDMPDCYKLEIMDIITVMENSGSLRFGVLRGEYTPITTDNQIWYFSCYNVPRGWDFIK
jgi:hypothetical protein